MSCEHKAVTEQLALVALGSQYLTVKVCLDCPMVWVVWDYPLREGDLVVEQAPEKARACADRCAKATP